jgi:hypothetical protein
MAELLLPEPIALAEARGGRGIILIFNSIHRVLRAEKALLAAGIGLRLVPTPRPLVSDCGMAIVVAPSEASRGVTLLKEQAIQVVQIYWDAGEAMEAMVPVKVD